MPIPGSKSSLWHIRYSYFQLMVTGSQVNLGEDTRTMLLIEQVINARKRILVLYGYLVQLPVVYAHPKTPILLLYKQNRSTPRRCTWSNEAFTQQLLKLGF